jgi:hypothetical protein
MIITLVKTEFPVSLIGVGVFLVCALVSVPCFLARLLLKKFAHKRAVYIITNRRAILYTGKTWGAVGMQSMQSWNAVQMRKLERKDSSYWKGCGSIVFEYRMETHHSGGTGRGPGRSQVVKVPVGFIDLRDVRKVERFLRESLIDSVTEKLLDDKPIKKTEDEEDDESVIDDPNVKRAPGVRSKKDADEDEDDPNVKRAPGAKPKKKDDEDEVADLEEVKDENVKESPGAKPARAKAAAGDEIDTLEEADEDANVKTRQPVAAGGVESEDVPEPLRALVDDELTGKEKLLWIGMPNTKLAFLRAAVPAVGVLCGALFFGCIFGCVAGNVMKDSLLIPALMGLVFFGVFVGAIVYPFVKRFQATKSVYAVTNKRCLVFNANFLGKQQLTSYQPEELVNMYRRDAFLVKGAGDIVFKTKTVITTTHYRYKRGGYAGSSSSATTYYYGFMAMNDPRPVEMLIRETLVDPILDKLTEDDD